MSRPLPIAVVGAGPAGSLAAAALAAAGHGVVLIEERLEWEKPCGGGVTDKALRRYPFLGAAAEAYNCVRECELISPRGRRALLSLDRTLAVFSRRTLNRLLLERAGAAGVEVVHDRAVGLAAADGAWVLELRGRPRMRARAVVVAAGARNPL
ncbi:MAG: NAD(P)/FAD-dependent oxidoreductase, partial [Terriglobales bacterium]